jgi:hypothetical protein
MILNSNTVYSYPSSQLLGLEAHGGSWPSSQWDQKYDCGLRTKKATKVGWPEKRLRNEPLSEGVPSPRSEHPVFAT